MLVLVTVRNVCLTQSLVRPLAGVSLLILVMVGAPVSHAQFADGSSSKSSVSVLATPESGATASAANGSATITNGSSLSVRELDSSPTFPLQPQPPQELLAPRTPDLDSFTKPLVSSEEFSNDLRSEEESNNVVTASYNSPAQDRSGAIGTQATTNQGRQNPSSFQPNRLGNRTGQARQFTRPPSRRPTPDNAAAPRGSFSPPPSVPPIVSSAGTSNPTSASSRAPSVPSVPSQAFSSNSTSNSSSASTSPEYGPVVPGATSWRREPGKTSQPVQHSVSSSVSSNQGRSTQSYSQGQITSSPSATARAAQPAGQRFNAGANSTYNQGVNPSIASGVPRVSQSQNRQANRNFGGQPVRQAQPSFNRDNSVRPTGFAQPVPQPKKIRTDLAKQLIARYSTDGINPQQLNGQPVKLFEMLNQPISTDQRRPMIHQFWDTYFDWASLVNSRQYQRLLDDIPGGSGGTDQALLETAKMDARNEVLASEIQLVKSQSKLTQFMPNRPSTLPPPIPNDLPLIQKYKTQYERYKQFQLMPANLLGIDKMLPKTLELISNRADTVQLAQSTNQKVVAGIRNRQSSVADALTAAKSWRAAEQSLLVAVMDYNHAICDYSMTVSGGYQSPQQVVGMLIARPQTNATSNPTNSVANRFGNTGGTQRSSQSIINSQPAISSQASNQRFNSPQNSQASQASNFGGANFRPSNFGSNTQRRSNQAPNTVQGGGQFVGQGQPTSPPVEAGAASAFRSNPNRFGNSAPNNVASSSNATAAKSSQGFSLGGSNGFQPPTQNSFGGNSAAGQSQFKAPTASAQRPQAPPSVQRQPQTAQRPQPPQRPQSDPFGRTGAGTNRSANSQFQRPFGQ